jgi:hypothetical protein
MRRPAPPSELDRQTLQETADMVIEETARLEQEYFGLDFVN